FRSGPDAGSPPGTCILTGAVEYPQLVLKQAEFVHNLAAMREFCAARGGRAGAARHDEHVSGDHQPAAGGGSPWWTRTTRCSTPSKPTSRNGIPGVRQRCLAAENRYSSLRETGIEVRGKQVRSAM